MVKTFSDLYGGVAADYAHYRPHYPPELFAWLASLTPRRDMAWDCACGSGQATSGLAAHFENVIATDASAGQIELARQNPVAMRIKFRRAAAETSGLPDRSADLINVGMAAHWFDLPVFYDEARRILREDGVLSLIGYGEPEMQAEAGEMLKVFIAEMEPFGPPERSYIKSAYRTLKFPFSDTPLPKGMKIESAFSRDQLQGYLNSRSTVIEFRRQTGRDPVAPLLERMEKILDDAAPHPISWPLFGRVARIGL